MLLYYFYCKVYKLIENAITKKYMLPKINKIIEDTSDSCEYLPRQLLCDFIDILVKLTVIKQKLSLDL